MGTKRRYSKPSHCLPLSSQLEISIEMALKEQQKMRDILKLNNIFNKLAHYVSSINIKSVTNSQQAIIRFHNDYGVSILPLFPLNGKKFYEIMVLRFHGSGFNDYKIAQYATVPEINWVSTDEDILRICRQVYLLKKKEEGPLAPRIAV